MNDFVERTAAANWLVTDRDRELFDRELQSFVPDRVFDAHLHWYRVQDFSSAGVPASLSGGPEVAGYAAFLSAMELLLPGREMSGLAFPFPSSHLDEAAANRFLIDELTVSPSFRGQLLVTPQMDIQQLHATVQRHQIAGLKCYHVYSSESPTFQSSISGFLPDEQLQLADDLGLSITLHLVKSRALAEPENQAWILRTCRRYPGLKLILAHAARGFNPHHTMAGIAAIAGLPNVWFDTSVVTDAGALEVILQTFGAQRLLYGSDFPVSQIRGRCVALGDSFFWISPENTRLQVPYADLELSFIGLEALRTLKVAAVSQRLTDVEVEAIFHENGRTLWLN